MLAWIALSLAAEVEGPWAGGAYVDLAPGPDGVHAAWVDGSTLRYARLGQPTETVADVVEAGAPPPRPPPRGSVPRGGTALPSGMRAWGSRPRPSPTSSRRATAARSGPRSHST